MEITQRYFFLCTAFVCSVYAQTEGEKAVPAPNIEAKVTGSQQYDPRVNYKPFGGLTSAVDDFLTASALRCRYRDLVKSEPTWPELTIKGVAKQIPATKLIPASTAKQTLRGAINASIILYGQLLDGRGYHGGGVVVSRDGYALTCEHNITSMKPTDRVS